MSHNASVKIYRSIVSWKGSLFILRGIDDVHAAFW